VSWMLFGLSLLACVFASVLAANLVCSFHYRRMKQLASTSRLSTIELQVGELSSSFDSLMTTWKRFRSAEAMREMRERRKEVREPKSTPTTATTPSANWKDEKRKELGMMLAKGQHPAALHDQTNNQSPGT